MLYQEAKKFLIIKLKKDTLSKKSYQEFKIGALSCLKKYLIKKKILYQEAKKGALSRNLNKGLKRSLIKNLHKILYNLIKSKKVPFQGT